MTQRVQSEGSRAAFPRSRTFGTAAATGRQQLSWIWTRESLLRLVLSFVLAVALWLYVTDKQNPAIARDFGQPLPITYQNIAGNVALANSQLGYAYVQIKQTDPNAIVTTNSFHVWIDLLGLDAGRHRVRVHVLADPGIQIVKQNPESMVVLLQQKEYKHVPVQPNITGHPPLGYGYQVKVSPSTTQVSGPKSFVSQVTRATFGLDLAGLRTNVTSVYQITPESSQGSAVSGNLNLKPSQVTVTVTVKSLSSYKTVPVLPRIQGQPKTGYGVVSLVSHPAEVTLTGSPKRLSAISVVNTQPISVTHRGGGTFTVHVPLKLPDGARSPTRTVTVTGRLAPVESSSSVQIGVIPTGVSSTLGVKVAPVRLLATVAGPPSALRSAGRNVKATLNLAGYGAGTYTLSPTVRSTDGVQVLSVFPRTVKVTLSPVSSS